jgi:putative oxidoreductase
MSAILLIGRILFALLFISSGINHFTKLEAMTGYAKYKKLPAAKLGVLLSGLMILAGGLFILLGVWADLGGLLIGAFGILVAFIFHTFWKESDATAKMNETTSFFKALALSGAGLIIFGLVAKHGDIAFGWHIGSHLNFFK